MAMMRTAPLLLLIAAAAAPAACTAETGVFRTAGGPEKAVQVRIRDAATAAPIAGAAVSAEMASRDHPFSAASIMGQTGPDASRASTDERGEALVTVLDDREYRIVVWAPGRAPVAFGPAALRAAAGGWIDPELPPGGLNPGIQASVAGEGASAPR